MDREIGQLLRAVQRSNGAVALARELIFNMNDVERANLRGMLDFYTERQTREWTLEGVAFPIAKLPDSTIKRLINESSCIRSWLGYLRTLKRATDWDGRPNVYETILDEAEHRGILSGHQKRWIKLRDNPTVKEMNKLRLTRCKHDYVIVGSGFTCSKCHLHVTKVELKAIAASMLRGRLREWVG